MSTICPVQAEPLDRLSALPLWAQLETDLRRRLELGEFDDRFPTDAELTEQYEVSRHTVREAIRRLNATGLLRRERGRGTVVDRSEFVQPLGGLYSLFQSIESAGVEQNSEVLQLGLTTDSAAAAQLKVEPDTQLVLLERLRLAAGAPLAVDRAWLPHDLAAPLLDVDFSHTALYVELERACGFRPSSGWERLTPILPSAADRRSLGLSKTSPAFFLERLGMHDGEPIEWRTTTIRGDRYCFVADWSPDVGSGLKMTIEQ